MEKFDKHVLQITNDLFSHTLKSGQIHYKDLILLARGIKQSPVFDKPELPIGLDGGLLVNNYLQCSTHKENN